MQWITNPNVVVILASLTVTSCSKSDEYYEVLGERGQVSTLLSELESDSAKVRANALAGLGFAAQYARPAWASERHHVPVDPAKLVPAVDPVIKALGDQEESVRYCAAFTLRCFAESVQERSALSRITDALVKNMPPADSSDKYNNYVEGLTAIAARRQEFPKLAAKAQAALGAEHKTTRELDTGRGK